MEWPVTNNEANCISLSNLFPLPTVFLPSLPIILPRLSFYYLFFPLPPSTPWILSSWILKNIYMFSPSLILYPMLMYPPPPPQTSFLSFYYPHFFLLTSFPPQPSDYFKLCACWITKKWQGKHPTTSVTLWNREFHLPYSFPFLQDRLS